MISRLALLILLAARIAHADDGPPMPPDQAKPADSPAAPDKSATPDKSVAREDAATPPKQVTVVVANGLLQRQGISPEFTITGGIKLWKNDNADSRWWMGRVRAGVLIYQE